MWQPYDYLILIINNQITRQQPQVVSNKPAMTTMMNPMATNQQQANPFGVAMATSNQPTMNQMMFPQQQNNFMTSQQPSMMTSQQQMFPMMQQQHMGGFMTSQQMMGGNQHLATRILGEIPNLATEGGAQTPLCEKVSILGIFPFSSKMFSKKEIYGFFFRGNFDLNSFFKMFFY